ncbi:putative (6-4)DNA photolyase [Helianthus annuus]|uniref:(6-4)DNA photolyase n=1 Tax=Helianthus annuus TaxID=4232 RepID=A0A9K3HUZ9_HELAN|nr:blue-light photoreceptor PHR2 isoform X1 [Helianthus annuus]KAF5785208.1 putative (6-4)DNA photolyase [Helianthus annuus]KAJ0520455.1 putative (6-4)DNA photolyase [Helianthus annuus]KAJ0528914.1 putative (6-4)DNA photolyase [Helianthus annuus]KAJ0695828.1 putative (6-4)DNA photolyase [Helianthus annuus]
MASKSQDSQNPDTKTPPETHSHLPIIPFTSITLSLSKFTPTHFISPPTISPTPQKIPVTLKIPSQIASIFNLSLSSSSLSVTKSVTKSTVSANPLSNPLSLNPRRPSDPSSAAALRRVSVVWFRNDLRVHDNESLNSANNESVSVLPVYCFDPNEFGNSSFGFDKTGPNRANFLIESVSDLRKNLQARGSDLVVRIGKPETVLAELVKEVGADAVYMHREVSNEECKGEQKIETVLKDEGVEVKYFWGSTLYHIEDLPFKLEEMPTNYGGFREKVKGVKVRNTIEVLDQLKGLPSGGNVEPGEIPSLADLGLNPTANMTQVKPVINGPLIGGETEALNRLKKFASECQAQPPKESKDGNNDSVYGASFSCKISPWLAMGCVSPRAVFDELKKSTSRTISAGSNRKDGGDSGMNWLMYELMWRDFFRFITRKYSSSKQQNKTPVAA